MTDQQQPATAPERVWLCPQCCEAATACGDPSDMEYIRADLCVHPVDDARVGEIEKQIAEIEALSGNGSLILPLRVEGWHISLTDGGWLIKNALGHTLMTVGFVDAEKDFGRPALDGNAPARTTAALLNAIPALCATVRQLLSLLPQLSSSEPHRCPRCGRRMKSDLDPDVGKWYECESCDYREPVSSNATVSGGDFGTLRQAVQAVGDLPDISGDDGLELKRLCEQSAREVKLVGSVSASTSLEMIGHMRYLESLLRSKSK